MPEFTAVVMCYFSYMLFFAVFVGKNTLICILSPTAPLGGKFVGLSSLNESLILIKVSCYNPFSAGKKESFVLKRIVKRSPSS